MTEETFTQAITECDGLFAMLVTVDSHGQLMPSFLWTPTSDYAANLGWIEPVEIAYDGRSINWLRLTAEGRSAKEIADAF